MKAKARTKIQTFRFKREYVLWVIIILLTVLLITSAWYIKQLWEFKSSIGKQYLTSFINNIEERRYKYPVISISENRVYIPEIHSYLPLNDTTRNLRYEYVTIPDLSATLNLSLSSSVGRQIDTDNPACDRMVTFTKSNKSNSADRNLSGEMRPLSNGFHYAYGHTNAECKIYSGNDVDNLKAAGLAMQQY